MDESSFLRRIHEHPDDAAARREYHVWLKQANSPRATYMDLMARRAEAEAALSAVDEQLGRLTDQVGPHWISALFPKPGKNAFPGGYTLNDGREIQIEYVEQYFTYGGLIEGLPHDKMNERILNRLVDEERRRTIGEPYLIPPVIKPIEWLRAEPYPFGTPQQMPSMTCISRWSSRETARDKSKDGSALSIIWFQDHFAFPIADAIVEHILALDWNTLAIDFEH